MSELGSARVAAAPLETKTGTRLYSAALSSVTAVFHGRELFALVDQALVSGTNFLTNVVLARALGLSEFGTFALAWMVVLFVNSLQLALIVSPMMSIGPKQDPSFRSFYFGVVTLQEVSLTLVSAVLVFAGTLASSFFFPQWGIAKLALPLAFVSVAYLLQDFTRRYFFTTAQTRRALSNDLVSYLPQLPVLMLFAKAGRLTTISALWIIAVTSLFGVVLSCFWFERLQFSRAAWNSVTSRHWKTSRWLTLSTVLQWASTNLFVLFSPIYYGPAAAGALRACQNIVGVAHIWFLGLDNVVPAEAARQMHQGGVDAALRYLRQILIRWGSITVLFAFVIGLAPSFWLHLAYGAVYSQFGMILRLYAVLYIMVFLSGPLRAGLQTLEYASPLAWAYGATSISAVIFAAPLAKYLGLTGVMYGLIGTQAAFQIILAIALLRRADHERRLEKQQAGI